MTKLSRNSLVRKSSVNFPRVRFAAVLSGFTAVVFASIMNPANASSLTDSDYLYDGAPDAALVELGRDLFFDPVLSGNRNISCASCHNPSLGTSDAQALGLGEGATGSGIERKSDNAFLERLPRNAPALWNVGARSNSTLFHDGRIEFASDSQLPNGIRSPAGEQLPEGLHNTLAAQALFPPLSPVEMAGQPQENPVADAVAAGMTTLAWEILSDRLRGIADYVAQFTSVFKDVETAGDIEMTHAANALAAFQTVAFRADQSRFDELLRTGSSWLFTAEERRGMSLFYNEGGCARCHSGSLLTDNQFHAIAMPQIGPGKDHGTDSSFKDITGYAERLEDEGRFVVTGDPADKFRFRTPSLRNVTETAPYGHDGAYASLQEVVRHHLDPVKALHNYTPLQLSGNDQLAADARPDCKALTAGSVDNASNLHARDVWVQCNPGLRQRIAEANELEPVNLTDKDVDDIVAFLSTLTDTREHLIGNLVPSSVPSGLSPGPF